MLLLDRLPHKLKRLSRGAFAGCGQFGDSQLAAFGTKLGELKGRFGCPWLRSCAYINTQVVNILDKLLNLASLMLLLSSCGGEELRLPQFVHQSLVYSYAELVMQRFLEASRPYIPP